MLLLSFHQTAVDGGIIMSKYIPGNQKHLTLEDRIFIQNELDKGTTFKDIARFLCKDPTTISKEVKSHRVSDWYHIGAFYNARFANRKYRDNGLFMARNVDLVRKVKFKPRKCHKTQIKDRSVFEGRTYLDFQELGLNSFTEMDTVHSAGECKRTLLNFFLTEEKLFLAFIMNRNTKGAVRLVFDHLEKRMGAYDFLRVFDHTLTDRGSEFGDPESLETGI